MRLKTPLYMLRRSARLLARREGIPLHRALDRVAADAGFPRWSLLVAREQKAAPAAAVYAQLAPGDLVLVGARPGQGKTMLALELAIEAMRAGNQAAFFSLDYSRRDMPDRFRSTGVEPAEFNDRFLFDDSDLICADHIVRVLQGAPSATLAVIDYLQLLDQRRETACLDAQIEMLGRHARASRHVLVFVSQIDRSFDAREESLPDLGDIRLPNPLDLSRFDKACFLHEGQVGFGEVGQAPVAVRAPNA